MGNIFSKIQTKTVIDILHVKRIFALPIYQGKVFIEGEDKNILRYVKITIVI